MRNADKNRDPGRATKRARADLRCAARKLGHREALAELAALFDETGLLGELLPIVRELEAKRADFDADGYWIGEGDPPAGAHRAGGAA